MNECNYCGVTVEEGTLPAHLHDAHEPEELSRIDRRRVERYTDATTAGVSAKLPAVAVSRRSTLVAAGAFTALAGIGSVLADDVTEIEDWFDLDNIRITDEGAEEFIGGLDGEYVLVNDLDEDTDGYDEVVDTEDGFNPIGESDEEEDTEFTGSFDGDGHVIADLVIDRPGEADVGLFGAADDATIENVHLESPEVTGGNFTGSLVGFFDGGRVEDASVTVGEKIEGAQQSGGLLGAAGGTATIEDAEATIESTVKVTPGPNVGGLAGDLQDESEVINGHVTVTDDGEILASDPDGIGGPEGEFNAAGLVGSAGPGEAEPTIRESTVTVDGRIEADADGQVAGITGFNSGEVIDSEASVPGELAGSTEVAGLVGRNNGKITDSNTTGDVSGVTRVGGLVGRNNEDSVIEDSHATGDVDSNGNGVGGLVGSNDGTIEDSHATGDVTGSPGVEGAGGLVGFNDPNSNIIRSHATGEVTGDLSVGGLVGQNDGGSVEESYATGDIDAREDTNQVGGLVGFNDGGSVEESYATGDVTDGDSALGGLVGFNQGSIENSYAEGDVEGDTDGTSQVGGLVGQNRGDISESYATGNVEGSTSVGGFAGTHDSGTIEASYATGDVTADERFDSFGGYIGRLGSSFDDADDDHILRDSYVLLNDDLADEKTVIGEIEEEGDGDGDVIIEHGRTTLANDGETSVGDIEEELIDEFAREEAEMQGESAETEMDVFDFEETWETVPGEFPELQPQVDDPPEDPAPDGPAVSVDGDNATVTNTTVTTDDEDD